MVRMWSYVAAFALVSAMLHLESLTAAAGICEIINAPVLAIWNFDGTYDETSHFQRGPAIPAWDRSPVGGDINLAFPSDAPCNGYVHIGNPGFLELPRVDFWNVSFTYSFSMRLNGGQSSQRRILYADWSQDNWQFLTFVTTDNKITIWFRNGAQQTFLDLTTVLPIPLGVWTNVAVAWDRVSRLATIYVNLVLYGIAVVPTTVTDINLYKSNSYYYQFGSKADTSSSSSPDYAPLDADLRNLKVYTGLVLTSSKPSELLMRA